jgi:hypothetical protein
MQKIMGCVGGLGPRWRMGSMRGVHTTVQDTIQHTGSLPVPVVPLLQGVMMQRSNADA